MVLELLHPASPRQFQENQKKKPVSHLREEMRMSHISSHPASVRAEEHPNPSLPTFNKNLLPRPHQGVSFSKCTRLPPYFSSNKFAVLCSIFLSRPWILFLCGHKDPGLPCPSPVLSGINTNFRAWFWTRWCRPLELHHYPLSCPASCSHHGGFLPLRTPSSMTKRGLFCLAIITSKVL